MAKVTRANEGAAPKKRSRKSTPENGTATASASTISAAAVQEPVAALEEKIRERAYQLFLQRGGQGGSPEQDWFQATTEISGQ